MCGIIGGTIEDKNIHSKLISFIKHRGPDYDNYYQDKNILLCQTLLRIRDNISNSIQPYFYKNLIMVFNGEIYNTEYLSKLIQNKNESKTDTEVIIKLFDLYRENMFKLLNGMFAIVIYDKNTRELFLARDMMGIKPLYYLLKNNNIYFSSESLPLNIFDVEIDQELYNIQINSYFNLEQTIFKNILSFKSGHYGCYSKGKLNIYKFKTPLDLIKLNFFDIDNEEYLINHLDKILNKTIQRQLETISDIKIGIICSGGLDSSLISAIASKYINKLNLYVLAIDGADESNYAKLVASNIKSNITVVPFNLNDFNKCNEKLLKHMSGGVCEQTWNIHPMYKLFEEIKKDNCKVILTGEGADELFGGYDRYLTYNKKKFKSIKDNIDEIIKINHYQSRYNYNILEYKKHTNSYYKLLNDFYEKNKLKNYNNEIDLILDSLISFDTMSYLSPLLHRNDLTSMAHGIECRPVFVDNVIVEFALNLNVKFKIKNNETKYLLKKVAERYLPNKIIYRHKCGLNSGSKFKFANEKKNREKYQKKYLEYCRSINID